MMTNKTLSRQDNEVRKHTHIIEKEYINSMLNTPCPEAMVPDKHHLDVKNDVTSHDDVKNDITVHDDVNYIEIDNSSGNEYKVFCIAGLNLAFPLADIKGLLKNQHIELDNEKFLETGMCIGKTDYLNENIVVIDLTNLIMNDVHDFDYLKKYDGKTLDIVLLKNSSAGIIYEREIDNQTILQENVCWRNEESNRIWLAGTVKKQGFSLLDAEGILSLINNKC